jgi:hydrogenase maturation protein HypF
VADPTVADAYPLPRRGAELDTRVLVRALLDDRSAVPIRAARFHNGLADGLAALALDLGEPLVALAGGCMINRLLVRRLGERLRSGGAQVLIPRLLPPGDGAISAGQAAVAACRLATGD